jgi:hypothetical protein
MNDPSLCSYSIPFFLFSWRIFLYSYLGFLLPIVGITYRSDRLG